MKEEYKNYKFSIIFEAAFSLFSIEGIDTVTMIDIANKAGIGVATLYRYFVTKEELSIQCADYLWSKMDNELSSQFITDDFNKKTGLEQISVFFNTIYNLYIMHPDFFKFICFFDSYIYKSKVTKCNNLETQLNEYENTIKKTKNKCVQAIEKGFNDGTITTDFTADSNLLYYTISHSLLSLAKKLVLSNNMLQMNKEVPENKQLRLLADLLLESITKK